MHNIDLDLKNGDSAVQQLDTTSVPVTPAKEDPPEIIRIFRPLQSKYLTLTLISTQVRLEFRGDGLGGVNPPMQKCDVKTLQNTPTK